MVKVCVHAPPAATDPVKRWCAGKFVWAVPPDADETAASPSTSPEPQSGSAPAGPASSAVDLIVDFTCAGVHVGCVSNSNAARPATNGDAIDVPSFTS